MLQKDNIVYVASVEEMIMLFRYQNMLPMMFFSADTDGKNRKKENAILAGLYKKGFVTWEKEQIVCCDPMLSMLNVIKSTDTYLACKSESDLMDSFLCYWHGQDAILIKPESAAGKNLLLEENTVDDIKKKLKETFKEEFRETTKELFETGNPANDHYVFQFELFEKSTGRLIRRIKLIENGISDILAISEGESLNGEQLYLREKTDVETEVRTRFTIETFFELLGL